MPILQDMLTALSFLDLPPAWQDHDLVTFSPAKRLWDYQREALQFALKALWKYYEDFRDFAEGEPVAANAERKARLWQWYQDNGLEADLAIPLKKQKRDVRALLEAYYPVEEEYIPYRHFINRMGFWMATGSGKSLVLIKLIEILWHLMRQEEIPEHPVLVLTARNDLLAQLKAYVDEFNEGRTDFRIHLEDLRAYPERQRMFFPLIGEHEITVFFYRADNLSDEQKERIVDFRNYENEGRWYVLLDEAHKGDREDSKRQHIYSILSRHGFLFNFSATFTDPRDILTTVYNFNLSEFVRAGYGKHIIILKQENRAFKDKEDYTGAEKQRVVLKALLMLAYVRKAHETLPLNRPAYHRPLMLTLVNSVNTKDADLKLFFRELERIAQGKVDEGAWKQAREELWEELAENPKWLFENQEFQTDRTLFDSITPAELLRLVFNASTFGEIEVLLRPSNRQEMAFKLKSAAQPFALIKIGDITSWLKEELEGYEIVEGYEDEGFFQRLNEEDSPINILMGSRTFYEGWDSNRPNVITYINIGTGTEAKKFILQSVGRGVRIEPFPGHRKRLLALYNAGLVDKATFQALTAHARALETLCIFGTNRKALHTVIEQLDQEKRREAEHEIALQVNAEILDNVRSSGEQELPRGTFFRFFPFLRTVLGWLRKAFRFVHQFFSRTPHLQKSLLIPTYREVGRTIIKGDTKKRKPRKFEIVAEELEQLQRFMAYLDDPRLLILHYHASPVDVAHLARILDQPTEYFNLHTSQRYGRLDILLSRLFSYFRVIPQEAKGLKPLEGEIRHFRHIKVYLRDITELQAKITAVMEAPQRIAELHSARWQLTREEFSRQAQAIRSEDSLTHNGQILYIKRIAHHYYLPVLLSKSERIDWIRPVIRHPSEVQFLNDLEQYLSQSEHAFQHLDWWAFSKIDEAWDEVYIPYYDPQSNRMRRFLPDFIFWLQKGSRYAIVFVDPKGMQLAHYQHKVDGYKEIFWKAGAPRTFYYDDYTVQVHLLLYTKDANQAPAKYQEHWFDRVETIAQILLD